MEFIGLLWNELLMRPMINGLVVLYTVFFGNFGMSIIVFTLLVRFLTMPLTLKQIRQTRNMSQLAPKLSEIKAKYANDKQRISQETMRLYREGGVNPLGCLGPMVIQMPIWIALYQSLIQILPTTPEAVSGLSTKFYSWLGIVHQAVPLDSSFLWLDLASPPDSSNFVLAAILPLMVGVSMWIQQKMMIMPSTDPKQAQTNKMMLWMMPLMFMFFTFSFPSGLALYWVISNIVGISIQYFVTGWGGLLPQRRPQVAAAAVPTAPVPALTQPDKELHDDGERRSDGQDRRRGQRNRPNETWRKTGRRHHRGPKPG